MSHVSSACVRSTSCLTATSHVAHGFMSHVDATSRDGSHQLVFPIHIYLCMYIHISIYIYIYMYIYLSLYIYIYIYISVYIYKYIYIGTCVCI